ncbi:CPBP family intramembrane metalloprotease [Bacillus shivajii]|uniref:CPBP family glutamic-type intramembrane protease n=1 Tax=Bacillus shivajii TaxID=1983719 RepID=UPI001CFB49D8|nr:CPBP family glutamic-type intramembrane protease [Bacillus shivajii]UCZ54957.1 CPBP family intramembrane metalloprotease [Bacillus shivajii]
MMVKSQKEGDALFVLRVIAGTVVAIVVITTMYLLNGHLKLGMTASDIDMFTLPFITIIFFLIVFPTLRKHFFEVFVKTKELHLIIGLPILFVLTKLFVTYAYMFLPLFFQGEKVGIGSNQYVAGDELSIIGMLTLSSVLAPFNEEFLFRFFLLFFIPYVFLHAMTNEDGSQLSGVALTIHSNASHLYNKIFLEENRLIIMTWVIAVSCFFSYLHGPDMVAFPIYFVGGLLYSYLFLKYGFLAAWFAHGFSNAMSPIIYMIFLAFFYSA